MEGLALTSASNSLHLVMDQCLSVLLSVFISGKVFG